MTAPATAARAGRRGPPRARLSLQTVRSRAAALLVMLAAGFVAAPATAQSGESARPRGGEPELSPGAFLRYAGGAPLARPPFPDAWEPNPLRFPYAENDSLYLPPPVSARAETPRETAPEKLARFAPPGGTGRVVRVLVQPQTRSVLVNARGAADFQWRTPGGRPQRGEAQSGPVRVERRDGRFTVTPVGGKAQAGGGAIALRIAPLDGAPPLELNGKSYRGTLEFHPEGAGLVVINVLPLEEYLRGVVPLEMGRHDESRLEALKAQAVAARTYAVKRALARTRDLFDLHSSVQDQVYGGAGAEHPVSDRAIRETAGVLLLHGDSLAHTYYHSTCGGKTASRHEVWGGPPVPYLISGEDSDAEGRVWCRASRYMDWTQSWDADALAAIMRKNLPDAGVRNAPAFSRLTGFEARSRFADGRISTLEVRTDRGVILLRGDKTRWALKPAPGTGRILESARFDIEIRGGRVTARGNGFGHGIGMCQMGALARSSAGQTYAQILDAYYPGTALAVLGGR